MSDVPDFHPEFDEAAAELSDTLARSEAAPESHRDAYQALADSHLGRMRTIVREQPGLIQDVVAIVELAEQERQSADFLRVQAALGHLDSSLIPNVSVSPRRLAAALAFFELIDPNSAPSLSTTDSRAGKEQPAPPNTDSDIPSPETKGPTLLGRLGEKYIGKTVRFKFGDVTHKMHIATQGVTMPTGDYIEFASGRNAAANAELLLVLLDNPWDWMRGRVLKEMGFRAEYEGQQFNSVHSGAKSWVIDKFLVDLDGERTSPIDRPDGTYSYRLIVKEVEILTQDGLAGADAADADIEGGGVEGWVQHELDVSTLTSQETKWLHVLLDSSNGWTTLEDLFNDIHGEPFNTTKHGSLSEVRKFAIKMAGLFPEHVLLKTEDLGDDLFDVLEIIVSPDGDIEQEDDIDEETPELRQLDPWLLAHEELPEIARAPAGASILGVDLNRDLGEIGIHLERRPPLVLDGYVAQAFVVLALTREPIAIDDIYDLIDVGEQPYYREAVRDMIKHGPLWSNNVFEKISADDTSDGRAYFSMQESNLEALLHWADYDSLRAILDMQFTDHNIVEVGPNGLTDKLGRTIAFSDDEKIIYGVLNTSQVPVNFPMVLAAFKTTEGYLDKTRHDSILRTFRTLTNRLVSNEVATSTRTANGYDYELTTVGKIPNTPK